jgi:hypothetical protein
MFPLIASITQQPTNQSTPIKKKKKTFHQSSIEKPESSFSESFISSGKQEEEQQFSERRDIVTRETCVPTSLNINILGKAAVLHFASPSLLRPGLCQTQPVDH